MGAGMKSRVFIHHVKDVSHEKGAFMINFNKSSVWNLKPIDVSSVRNEVTGLLVQGEEIAAAFKTVRDQLVFTNKRIISIDVQGLTGKRKSFSSMPYSKVNFFSDRKSVV